MPTITASDFRVNFTRHLTDVMAGETFDITKQGEVIARLMPSNVLAKPTNTISATAAVVQFTHLIDRLDQGETFHITKHKNVLASLTSRRYDVLTPFVPKSTVNVENDDTEEEAAYNATNDAMDQLSEDMNPVTPDTPASTPGFSPSGYRLDTLTPITPEDAAMSDALADIEASEEVIDEVETSEADIVDIEAATPVTPVGDDDHLDTLTMKELHSFANKHNITIPPRSRKSEVKAAIRADMVDMKIDDHDWLDEEHDDDYDAFFADLADRSELRRQRRNTTV